MDGGASRTRPARATTRGSRRSDSHQPRAARGRGGRTIGRSEVEEVEEVARPEFEEVGLPPASRRPSRRTIEEAFLPPPGGAAVNGGTRHPDAALGAAFSTQGRSNAGEAAGSHHEVEEETEGSRHSNPQQERHDRRTSLLSDDDSLDEAKDKRENAIKEAEEKRKDEQLQADMKREDMKNNMQNQKAFNEDMAKVQKHKKDNFKIAQTALGVDTNTMRSVQKNKALSSAAKMLFLVILVGCELDFVGFVMAARSYWGTGFAVVKVMLIVGPLSYIIALLMYKTYNDPESYESKRRALDVNQSIGGLTRQPSQASDLDETKKRNKVFGEFTNREPVKVEMYHCLPVVRMYLVIKDLVPNDIECVFRANSLSSFTFGTSQLVGFLFTMIGGAPLDIFQKINIASFTVNWTITILYFATSIPNRMKASMAADAVEYQTNVMLQKDFAEFKKNVDKYASTGSPKDKEEVDGFLHKVEREIVLYTSTKVAIVNEQFTPMQVNELRRAVHRKFNDEYANIV